MIDRIRALYPHLALGVYALEPGGPMTVEVFTPDGTRFANTAPTEAEAFTAIFGPLPEMTEQPVNKEVTNEQPAAEPVDVFS